MTTNRDEPRAAPSQAFLSGLTVLELGHALAGPFAGTILSDLGARVIKVEPLEGDPVRKRRGPDGVNYPFQMVHRNKLSTAIDIKTEAGRDLVKSIMAKSDVVVENFRPGVLKRHGLDGETSLQRLPHLVYCSISGYGQTGPMAHEGGVDLIAQATGGLMSVTGEAGRPPAKAGFPVGDLGAGMWGAIGILAALHRAKTTGQGAALDVALADTILSWALWEVADFQMTREVPGPLGNAHRLVAPYRAYECANAEWITVAGLASRWPAFCDLMGVAHLLDDPRFQSETDRYNNRVPLDEMLAQQFRTRPRADWIRDLRNIGMPCGPVQNIGETMENEQYKARDMWRTLAFGDGSLTALNTPIRDSGGGAPGPLRRASECGEDTRAVLQELGLAETDIDQLQRDGVVAAPG